MINSDKYGLDKSFQEIFCRTDNWINEGSGWIIESITSESTNIYIYSPLSGRIYTELPNKLRKSMKGSINIEINACNCFLWCLIRYLNPLNTHTEIKRRADKNMVHDLDYKSIKFPVSQNFFEKMNKKIIFEIIRFVIRIT